MIKKKKVGRPVSLNGQRNHRLVVRLSTDEWEKLNFMSCIDNKSKSDIIREALRIAYNLAVYRE